MHVSYHNQFLREGYAKIVIILMAFLDATVLGSVFMQENLLEL